MFDYVNYYRLSYIESSGTQYINTGVTESKYTNVDCKFYNPSPVNDYLFGGQQNSSNMLCNGLYADRYFEVNYTQTTLDVTFPNLAASIFEMHQSYNSLLESTELIRNDSLSIVSYSHLISYIYTGKYLDSGENEVYTVDSRVVTPYPASTFYIFACLKNDGTIRPYSSTLRLYYFTIRGEDDGNTVLRRFIPALRKSDSVVGLYDDVNDVFYTNAGTGSFIAGDIVSGYDLGLGVSIPVIPTGISGDSYHLDNNGARQGIPYSSTSTSSKVSDPTDAQLIPSSNGSQSWSARNEFHNSGTSLGFDEEGYVTEGTITESSSPSGAEVTLTTTTTGPAVIVTNLNTDILAGVGVSGEVVADVAYNAVWNDIADCIEVPEGTELEYGRAYCTNGYKFYKSRRYLDDGYIGIHSDTAGIFMGKKSTPNQLRVAAAGFVLAYVDQTYPPGTPLTISENGTLTKLKEEDVEKYPYKIVGTFWKDEPLEWWGFDLATTDNSLVEVKGRKWIKVK